MEEFEGWNICDVFVNLARSPQLVVYMAQWARSVCTVHGAEDCTVSGEMGTNATDSAEPWALLPQKSTFLRLKYGEGEEGVRARPKMGPLSTHKANWPRNLLVGPFATPPPPKQINDDRFLTFDSRLPMG